MDDITRMKEIVVGVYPDSITWKHRVYQMTDEQVTAIYLRFKREKRI
jgi:hypothetical protein